MSAGRRDRRFSIGTFHCADGASVFLQMPYRQMKGFARKPTSSPVSRRRTMTLFADQRQALTQSNTRSREDVIIAKMPGSVTTGASGCTRSVGSGTPGSNCMPQSPSDQQIPDRRSPTRSAGRPVSVTPRPGQQPAARSTGTGCWRWDLRPKRLFNALEQWKILAGIGRTDAATRSTGSLSCRVRQNGSKWGYRMWSWTTTSGMRWKSEEFLHPETGLGEGVQATSGGCWIR